MLFNAIKAWTQYASLKSSSEQKPAYRYQSLLPCHGQDSIVGVGPPGSGVDKDMHVLVDDGRRDGLLEHELNVLGLENLLKRVEGKTRQLGLDKVRPVLHDGFQLDVPVCGLPSAGTMPPPSRYQKKGPQRTNKHIKGKNRVSPGDQVKHVNAVSRAPLGLAGGACQLDGQESKQRLPGQPVPHLHQPGVEVDLTGERGDGQESGVAHDEEGGYCFLPRNKSWSASEDDLELPSWANPTHIKESWVDVGGLLQDDHVPSGSLRG